MIRFLVVNYLQQNVSYKDLNLCPRVFIDRAVPRLSWEAFDLWYPMGMKNEIFNEMPISPLT